MSREDEADSGADFRAWETVERLANRLAQRCSTLTAEDLTQEAFLALQKAAEVYNPEGGASFATFAWLAMRRRMVRLVERERSRPDRAAGGDVGYFDRCADPHGAESGDGIGLTELVGKLPTREADALRWRYGLDGEPRLTGAEIARRIGVSEAMVVRFHSRALARLRALFESDADPS